MEKDVWKELKGFRYPYRISEEAKLERQLPDGTWTRLNPYFSTGGGQSSALYASIAVLPMGHKRFSVTRLMALAGWWPAEPSVGRVANGVPSRVDRLKCLGNAVVPQQFYPIFQAIADIERGIIHG